jgi:uncharacterized membrane protein
MSGRAAQAGAVASLLALIALCLAWEIWLAPVRPGGSWLSLKAVPLLAPLFGLLHGRRRAFLLASFLALAYFTEGVARGWSEADPVRTLAALEALLALALFACALAGARAIAARR